MRFDFEIIMVVSIRSIEGPTIKILSNTTMRVSIMPLTESSGIEVTNHVFWIPYCLKNGGSIKTGVPYKSWEALAHIRAVCLPKATSAIQL
jgi:hypothetical protein